MKRKRKHNPYPSRLDMEERVFDAMVPEIEREGEEHELSSEMIDEKAFVLAEHIGDMNKKTLEKHYSFWRVKLGRKMRKKNPLTKKEAERLEELSVMLGRGVAGPRKHIAKVAKEYHKLLKKAGKP